MDEDDRSFRIGEVECRSILNRSRIPGIDYSINPYLGCVHGCIYCYARFMTRFSKQPVVWGQFCDAKVNAADVLSKQLVNAKKGLVSLSTVTDPYQTPERKYQLTRKILIALLAAGFPVSILTKSDLVLRDIDVLQQFGRETCDVGFSIATCDEVIRRQFEPRAPSIQKRMDALKILHASGIRTWVFIAPILPCFTPDGLSCMLDSIKNSVDSILVDRLNIKCGNWHNIHQLLLKAYPTFVPKWKSVLFSNRHGESHFQPVVQQIRFFCIQNGIPFKSVLA